MPENNGFKNKIMNFFRDHRTLFWILVGSFFVCLAYSFYFHITPVVDARAYDTIAKNIVSGNGYREDLQADLVRDFAIARVGPLYEYFLAGIYKIFGYSYAPVWLAQALLHAFSAWLIYLTAMLIFASNDYRRKIALWAAAIFAFYPDLIESSAMLLTETFYLFLVCLMIYLFFLYFSKGGNWRALLLGLVSGLATLARPPILFLIPVILFYFWRRKLWRPALLFLTILILVFVPWTVRNYQVYAEIMPFGSAGQFNFWIGNQPGGNGEQEPTLEQQHFLDDHKVTEINPESMRQFKDFVFNYPSEFIKLTLLRINKYFSVIRPMGFWFYQTGWSQLLFLFSSAIASVVLFVFGLAGAIKAWRAKKEKLNYLLVFLVFTPLIIFITVVETRYRFQIYPLLSIFAGFYIVDFFKIKRLDKYFWLAIVILLVNGSVDFILSWDKFRERIMQFF